VAQIGGLRVRVFPITWMETAEMNEEKKKEIRNMGLLYCMQHNKIALNSCEVIFERIR
jgi:hypothetical protein